MSNVVWGLENAGVLEDLARFLLVFGAHREAGGTRKPDGRVESTHVVREQERIDLRVAQEPLRVFTLVPVGERRDDAVQPGLAQPSAPLRQAATKGGSGARAQTELISSRSACSSEMRAPIIS